MKPEKSSTKNESIEFDVEKIRRFATEELAKLTDSPLPFCYQLGADTLIVGRYKVIRITDNNWRVLENSNQLFDFFTRKDAIFYCIALHKKDHKLAKEIKDNDHLLGQLESEAIFYRYRYKQAQKANDDWKAELYSTRYTETMARIEYTKQELKKSINSAKYIKV